MKITIKRGGNLNDKLTSPFSRETMKNCDTLHSQLSLFIIIKTLLSWFLNEFNILLSSYLYLHLVVTTLYNANFKTKLFIKAAF